MKKVWIHSPKNTKVQPTAGEKTRTEITCMMFIEMRLKDKWLKPFDPKNKKEMQLVDIILKWHGNYLYLIAKYRDLRPNVISGQFEDKVARLEFISPDHFLLSYLRHTGQWFELTYGNAISLKVCLENILELPHFAM